MTSLLSGLGCRVREGKRWSLARGAFYSCELTAAPLCRFRDGAAGRHAPRPEEPHHRQEGPHRCAGLSIKFGSFADVLDGWMKLALETRSFGRSDYSYVVFQSTTGDSGRRKLTAASASMQVATATTLSTSTGSGSASTVFTFSTQWCAPARARDSRWACAP